MRLIKLLALSGALAVAASPAQARTFEQAPYSKKVSITSAVDGPFTTTGHSLCASGQVATTFNFNIGSFPNGGFDLVVGKRFSCADGSGTFDLVLHVQIRFGPEGGTDNFRWLISAGTGRYEGIQGAGTGVGVTRPNREFVDVYTGRVDG